jgi:hypothetical protein
MSHHTEEQIQAGFAKAPGILKQLQEAGVSLPYFKLFADASGALVLGERGRDTITDEQVELATNLVKSMRPYDMMGRSKKIGITFCCGLTHEEETGDYE